MCLLVDPSMAKELEAHKDHKGPSAQNSPRPQRKGTNTSFLWRLSGEFPPVP